VVREEAAQVFADAGVYLVGTESQSVGPEEAPMRVHRILLSREVVLLEGIRLDEVPSGCYLLNASPLKIAGSDGAPCRAILMDWHEQEDTWLAEAVERIRSMEVIYDRLCEALDQDMSDPQWAFLLDTLKDYYEHGLWLSDYERDERGELPAALKRGVLSQDAVYHLLCDWDARRREKHV